MQRSRDYMRISAVFDMKKTTSNLRNIRRSAQGAPPITKWGDKSFGRRKRNAYSSYGVAKKPASKEVQLALEDRAAGAYKKIQRPAKKLECSPMFRNIRTIQSVTVCYYMGILFLLTHIRVYAKYSNNASDFLFLLFFSLVEGDERNKKFRVY